MLSTPAAAEPGQPDVGSSAAEPGGCEACVRRIPLMEADERFLSHVLGLLPVAQRLKCNADDASVLGSKQVLEGRLVAGALAGLHPYRRGGCLLLHSQRNRRRRGFCGRTPRQLLYRRRGSNASRTALPNRLAASTVRKIITPGKMTSHAEW